MDAAMESAPIEAPVVESAMDRKRRLRRERILNNTESRMRRILGDQSSEEAALAAPQSAPTGNSSVDNVAPPTSPLSSNGLVDGISDQSSIDDSTPQSNPTSMSTQPHKSKQPQESTRPNQVAEESVSTSETSSKETINLDQNGFHPQLKSACGSLNSSGEPEMKTLEGGAFGFDASALKNRKYGDKVSGGGGERAEATVGDNGSMSSQPWTNDALAWEDEEELRKAKNLLLRDDRPTSGSMRNSHLPTQPLVSHEPPPRLRKNAKRSSQEDALKEELERIMRQENSAQLRQPKPSSRQGQSTRRKPAASSQWYTKAWFRTSFAILLALFVRVLMQINLADHFSDSAFYPFFSMELCFFVAAFCSKPPGYRIPIGGGIVEMVTNLLGFSREILGNMKWYYEFAIQKPVGEFSLYFFVFAVTHLILKHVQDRQDLSHDEL